MTYEALRAELAIERTARQQAEARLVDAQRTIAALQTELRTHALASRAIKYGQHAAAIGLAGQMDTLLPDDSNEWLRKIVG